MIRPQLLVHGTLTESRAIPCHGLSRFVFLLLLELLTFLQPRESKLEVTVLFFQLLYLLFPFDPCFFSRRIRVLSLTDALLLSSLFAYDLHTHSNPTASFVSLLIVLREVLKTKIAGDRLVYPHSDGAPRPCRDSCIQWRHCPL
jgi:hypothetical protein